jgi:small subunit ribosomal protein S17
MRVRYSHLTAPQKIIGVVISTGMDRTAVVAISRFFLHPRTRKILKNVTKYFCHDHHELCGLGDRVHIKHWGAISKKKSHTVVDIVQRHPQLEGEPFPMAQLKRHPSLHAVNAGQQSREPPLQ